MKIKYNGTEWIIDSLEKTFRITKCDEKYILEGILPPCSDLIYLKEFETLGAAIEETLKFEMDLIYKLIGF